MGLRARVTRSFAAGLHNSRALWDFRAVSVVIEKFPRENAKCSSRHADTPIISGIITTVIRVVRIGAIRSGERVSRIRIRIRLSAIPWLTS